MEVGKLPEPLRTKQGQTYDETFYFNDENGSPVDMSGKTFSLVLRENPAAAIGATATCTYVAPNGCRVVISAISTALLKIRTYKTDLRITYGSVVDYGFEGDFIVEAPITKA